MKNAKHAILSASLAALVTPAFAIEAPPDDVPAIQVPRTQESEPSAEVPSQPRARLVQPQGKQRQEPAAPTAYLGLGSGAVPDILSAHIGLKAGEGVIVRSLDPTGPAAKAGFALNDVILKVDGKSIGSHADLSGQVADQETG
ncbi:MAG: PDZ domain-containing protein [Luteolibacter sp.]